MDSTTLLSQAKFSFARTPARKVPSDIPLSFSSWPMPPSRIVTPSLPIFLLAGGCWRLLVIGRVLGLGCWLECLATGRNTNRGLSEFAPFLLPPNWRKWWFSPRRIRRGGIGGFRRGEIAVQKNNGKIFAAEYFCTSSSI